MPQLLQDESDCDKNAQFFGGWTSNPKLFELSRGEIKLIKELVQHVQSIVNDTDVNNGLHHFQGNISKSRSVKSAMRKIMCDTPLGAFFVAQKLCDNTNDQQHLVNTDQLKEDLFKKATKIMNEFQTMNMVKQKQKFIKDSVKVIIENGNQVKGKLTCSYCDKNDPVSGVKVFYQRSLSSGYWILSNLKSHFSKHHSQREDRIAKQPQVKTTML